MINRNAHTTTNPFDRLFADIDKDRADRGLNPCGPAKIKYNQDTKTWEENKIDPQEVNYRQANEFMDEYLSGY